MRLLCCWILWVGCSTPEPTTHNTSGSAAQVGTAEPAAEPEEPPKEEAAQATTEPPPISPSFEGLQTPPNLGGGFGEHAIPSFNVQDRPRNPDELHVSTIEDAPLAHRVLRHHRLELKHCLGKGDGRATWSLEIDAEGKGVAARMQQNTFPNADAACIERTLLKGPFPPPAQGTVTALLIRG